jgi:hypothetical protein
VPQLLHKRLSPNPVEGSTSPLNKTNVEIHDQMVMVSRKTTKTDQPNSLLVKQICPLVHARWLFEESVARYYMGGRREAERGKAYAIQSEAAVKRCLFRNPSGSALYGTKIRSLQFQDDADDGATIHNLQRA